MGVVRSMNAKYCVFKIVKMMRVQDRKNGVLK